MEDLSHKGFRNFSKKQRNYVKDLTSVFSISKVGSSKLQR